MQIEYITLFFVILTSLIGTFFIVKTIYELFLDDKYKGISEIIITSENEDKAEYIIRTAIETTDCIVTVCYSGESKEVKDIINRLSSENMRVKIVL